uniref:Calcineurin-like phosphoesterase domain-containing protein n=1 Tax=Ananas comosus var. bracteatus TaxID=296719 RepID=A0A6V7PRV3_ANACO|nr:unnamed protein product [Ananas comosus var. bracteatus]
MADSGTRMGGTDPICLGSGPGNKPMWEFGAADSSQAVTGTIILDAVLRLSEISFSTVAPSQLYDLNRFWRSPKIHIIAKWWVDTPTSSSPSSHFPLIALLFHSTTIFSSSSASPRTRSCPSCPSFQLRRRPWRRVGAQPARDKSLRFSAAAGAAFKIAIFADLHYGENAWTDWGPQQDANSDRVLSAVLDKENPDFVIYLGDVVTANNLPIPNASLYWDRAISATRSRGSLGPQFSGTMMMRHSSGHLTGFSSSGIPEVRCPTANISSTGAEQCSFRGTPRIDLMNTEINNNGLSYSATGPRSFGRAFRITSHIYCQAKWFQAQSQIINPNGKVPEIIFWHIPSIAFSKVAPKPNSEIDKPCVGSINLESVAPQDAEWGIMDILAKRPSVKAIFSGHNHGLDWCCPYQKLWLCFARHTGYGGYGDWPEEQESSKLRSNRSH